MKKSVIVAAMFLAFASSAYASNDKNPCGNSGNNCNTAGSPVANGGNASAGAIGVGVGIASVNNDISIKPTFNSNISNDVRNNANAAVVGSGNSSNKIDNKNTNTNTNANLNNVNSSNKNDNSNKNSVEVGNTVNVQGDSTTFEAQKRDPVATAYAASIAPTAVCALSVSGGAQGVGFGFSFGKSFIDENCVLLEQARAASNLGQREVAVEMLMDIPAYAAAKARIEARKAK